MKVINKRISLEQFKSRTPSMIDFIDEDGYFVNLLNTDKTYSCYPQGNYNETPCDVILGYYNGNDFIYFKSASEYKKHFNLTSDSYSGFSFNIFKEIKTVNGKIEDYSDICYDTKVFKSNNCETYRTENYCSSPTIEYYVIPYNTLLRMYHFFNEYNSLLSDRQSCKVMCQEVVSSATIYWEFFVKTIDTEEYYNKLDEMFYQYGGKINVTEDGKIEYAAMDDFIINHVFKTFKIEESLQGYWHTVKLDFITALKWYYWFEDRYINKNYSSITVNNCSDTIGDCDKEPKYDCTDCVEYFNRGGNEMYKSLKNFIESFKDIKTSSASTSLDMQIYIQNTIDDMGEFSIFSTDWEGGVNYAPSFCNASIDIDKCCLDSLKLSGGTTVIYNDEIWEKACNGSGYTITDCRTFEFNDSEWFKRVIENSTNDYSGYTLSGYTTSKLGLFKNKRKSCDDLGNELNGTFIIESGNTYAQPLENSYLELPYNVGNVTRLSKIEDESNKIVAYWGDLLASMEFYCSDNTGYETEHFKATSNDNLTAINSAVKAYISHVSAYTFDYVTEDKLKCDVTYYLGAILSVDDNSNYILSASTDNSIFNGVKYTETLSLNKRSENYYISPNVSYVIHYYEISQNMIETEYGDKTVSLPRAMFEVYPNQTVNTNGVSFSNTNAFIDSPIFKEEYKLGSSSLENIDENIYIERPIIKPHERNLQLIDVLTLEALEQYGNGLIKIINN